MNKFNYRLVRAKKDLPNVEAGEILVAEKHSSKYVGEKSCLSVRFYAVKNLPQNLTKETVMKCSRHFVLHIDRIPESTEKYLLEKDVEWFEFVDDLKYDDINSNLLSILINDNINNYSSSLLSLIFYQKYCNYLSNPDFYTIVPKTRDSDSNNIWQFKVTPVQLIENKKNNFIFNTFRQAEHFIKYFPQQCIDLFGSIDSVHLDFDSL